MLFHRVSGGIPRAGGNNRSFLSPKVIAISALFWLNATINAVDVSLTNVFDGWEKIQALVVFRD